MNAVSIIPRGEPRQGALDRAALAVGTALVDWSTRRAERRAYAHERARAVDHESVALLVAARRDAQQIAVERDLAKARSYGLIR